MRLTLAVHEGSNRQEADALRVWLTQEQMLRGQVRIPVDSVPLPGAMGQPLELVSVLLSNTIALGNLLVAVAAWRQSRPRQPSVRIEVNGRSFILDTSNPGELEALARALREADGSATDG
ncbi:hypothetical protein AMK26_23675 [Streptomyces sp. CB03234]|uniref:effector-associated constant component EACC1 n=1 Tax=Streptomyces sp. (strain CB03234) TaxID=1703937 RepID=UPI00093A42F5|nr:hypothetical protein [Streptomyces sp. CB03234]OKK02612.1 hypothetical protein AMK26_23675 [Streptomyces sp. CB03234]